MAIIQHILLNELAEMTPSQNKVNEVIQGCIIEQFGRYTDTELGGSLELQWHSPGYEQNFVHDNISADPRFRHPYLGLGFELNLESHIGDE
jgi:hypothetical protein